MHATAKIINFSLLIIHNRYKFALSLVMLVYFKYSDSVVVDTPSEIRGGELSINQSVIFFDRPYLGDKARSIAYSKQFK